MLKPTLLCDVQSAVRRAILYMDRSCQINYDLQNRVQKKVS